MRLITLREWNQRQPKPRCMEQVRRWVRSCMIQPPPILDGREYLVDENAVKINPASLNQSSISSLTKRVKNGRTETRTRHARSST